MSKKIFLSILITCCFLLGMNNVKAEAGEGKIGSKTQYCMYCSGKNCRYALFAMDVNHYTGSDTSVYLNTAVRIFENDSMKEFEYDNAVVDISMEDVNYITSETDFSKGCPEYLHYFIIENDNFGPINVGAERNYHFASSPSISAYVEKRRAAHDSPDGGFSNVGEVETQLVYTLRYTYGFDDRDILDPELSGILPNLSKEAKEKAGIFNLNNQDIGCAVLTEPIKSKINWVLNLIKYAGAALVIILGAADFLKAVLSDEDNASKKAFEKFVKRLIAAVLLFLLPLLIQFLFTAASPAIKIEGFNKDAPTCGIGMSE